MEALHKWVLSIGVFFGLLAPQAEPVLNIKIYKTTQAINFSLEIENGVNKDMEALILASNPVTIQIDIVVDKALIKQCTHVLTYNLLDGYYTVRDSETGLLHRTDNKAAAFFIFTGFYNIELLSMATFEAARQKTIVFRAFVLMEDQHDFNPAVLWNYKEPQKKFTYKSVKEIPY